MVAAVFPLSQLSPEIVPCALCCHFLSDSFLLICLESSHPCHSRETASSRPIPFLCYFTHHPWTPLLPVSRSLLCVAFDVSSCFPPCPCLSHSFSSPGGSRPLASPLYFAVPWVLLLSLVESLLILVSAVLFTGLPVFCSVPFQFIMQ